MSGHSKWHSIKHKKAKEDAKRGQIFTRLIKEITIAARIGGGDLNGNSRLRTAVQSGKDANMPWTNIEKAIKKGTGELPGVTYEEVVYEGYGPGGVAILVFTQTDNKNRTTAEVRHVFSRFNGRLGEVGCVSWMFHKKGLINIEAAGVNEDKLTEIVLESGADDLENNGEFFTVTTESNVVETIRKTIEAAGFKVTSSETDMIPINTVKLEGKEAAQLLKLLEGLEELDDTQSVSANFDIPDEILAAQG